uniref:Uncharacterized protein n=1 Tax=Stephanocyclus meneghinianus TaxID=29205 RepID=A0A7S1KKY4_STEMN
MERYLLISQLSVNSSICIRATFNISLITAIKIHFQNTTSVNLAAGALSSDFSGVHNILQESVLHSGEGTRTRTESLGLLGTSIRLSEDVTLGYDDKVLS